MTPAEVAGASTSPAALPLSGRIEEGFRQRMAQLPPATQQFLLVAAAEAVGDPALVWRAAEGLGIEVDAASPAIGQVNRLTESSVPPPARALGRLPGGHVGRTSRMRIGRWPTPPIPTSIPTAEHGIVPRRCPAR